MVTIVTVILALSFLVFVHELGHFLAAKKVGVHVIEFSIGFPPKLFSKIIGKTEYLISAIPIGGYVRLKGQGIDDEDDTDPENYAAKSVFQRLLILVSGALMNLLVALVLLPLVYFIGYEVPAYLNNQPLINNVRQNSPADLQDIQKGDIILNINEKSVQTWKDVQSVLVGLDTDQIQVSLKRENEVITRQFNRSQVVEGKGFGWNARISTIIGNVSSGSQADKAGLQSGDNITHLDNIKLEEWSEISPVIQNSKGQPVSVRVLRNGQPLDFLIAPQWEESQNYWVFGITSETVYVSENLKDSIVLGVKRAYFLTVSTFEFLGRLIAGKEKSDSVGGPIKIVKMMGEAARTGASSLLTLVAFISLQFAIFNLLPIPALDGGHIFFLIIESISGKPLSKNLRMSIQKIGFSLLLLLILVISAQDLGFF